MIRTCKENFTDLMRIPRFPRKLFYNNIISKCNTRRGARKSDFISESSLYCGLYYCEINRILDFLDKLAPADSIIIDAMNVFQNEFILIMATLVIQFTELELDMINILINGIKNRITYIDKINLFMKIFSYFQPNNANIFFICQGSISQQLHGIREIPSVKPNINFKLYEIDVPCYSVMGGKQVNCNVKANTKNESDDIMVLLINSYLTKKNSVYGKNTYLWSYDNYDWFHEVIPTKLVQLKYINGIDNNVLSSIFSSKDYLRKDLNFRIETIYFENALEHFSYQSDNYKVLINEIIYKYRNLGINSPSLFNIINAYVSKIAGHLIERGYHVQYYDQRYVLPAGFVLRPSIPIEAVEPQHQFDRLSPEEAGAMDIDTEEEKEEEEEDNSAPMDIPEYYDRMDIPEEYEEYKKYKEKYIKYKNKYLALKNKF